MKVSAGLDSSEDSLPGLQVAALLLPLHMVFSSVSASFMSLCVPEFPLLIDINQIGLGRMHQDLVQQQSLSWREIAQGIDDEDRQCFLMHP